MACGSFEKCHRVHRKRSANLEFEWNFRLSPFVASSTTPVYRKVFGLKLKVLIEYEVPNCSLLRHNFKHKIEFDADKASMDRSIYAMDGMPGFISVWMRSTHVNHLLAVDEAPIKRFLTDTVPNQELCHLMAF